MKHEELEGWRRYAVVFGGILLSGAICSMSLPFLVAPRGTIGPTMLQAESPIAALLATLICLALAVGVGVAAGRLVNTAVGLFVVGAGLWVVRLRSGTAADLAFANGSLGLVVVETLLWGVLVLGATFAVFHFAGPLADIEPDDEPGGGPWASGLRGAAAGILIIPAVWVVARSELRVQTLMAVVTGGLAAGLAGRLLSPHAQPRLLFAMPCFFGAVGQILGMMMLREPLADAFVDGSLPTLLRPMPIDYAAGSLTGVAMGLGWAKSFLQQEEPAREPAAEWEAHDEKGRRGAGA